MAGELFLDSAADDIAELLGRFAAAGVHNDVEDEVCVARPHDHAEIVNAAQPLNILESLLERGVFGIYLLVIGLDGIHVYSCVAAERAFQLALDGVYAVVQLEDISAAVHLGVQRDHHSARAVIVNNEVVHADDGVRAHDYILDAFDKLRIGRLTEQRRECVLCNAVAGKEDKHRDHRACPAVDVDLKQPAYAHREKHDRRCDGVGQAVRTRGGHGRGRDLFADAAIIRKHIQLDED